MSDEQKDQSSQRNLDRESYLPVHIHTTTFGVRVMEHWLEQEIAQWVHHEGSIHGATSRSGIRSNKKTDARNCLCHPSPIYTS